MSHSVLVDKIIEPIIFRYISIGDIAHVGTYQPQLAAVYKNVDGNFAVPIGYDLVSIQGYVFCQILLMLHKLYEYTFRAIHCCYLISI